MKKIYLSLLVLAAFLFIPFRGSSIIYRLLWPVFGRYRVEGSALEIGSGQPVELLEVKIDDWFTYTNFQGWFHYENLMDKPTVELIVPPSLEIAEGGFSCLAPQEVKVFDRLVVCRAEVTPTLSTTIGRIAQSRLQSYREDPNFMLSRRVTEWSLAHPDSKALWGNSFESYQLLLKYRDLIDDRLGRRLVSYSLYSDPVELGGWRDPLTGLSYPEGVWEVEVSWKRETGAVEITKEHFRREDRWWRHFSAYDPEEMVAYSEQYKWLLDLIEQGER